jgi:hypothetical protein
MYLNDQGPRRAGRSVADDVALAIQGLRAAGRGFDALVRIDNRAAEAKSPFQFDAGRGLVHRRGCHAIPPNAPLFGLTSLSRDGLSRACKRCKPVPEPPPDTQAADRTDVLFGLVSLVDQFAGVLKERGKDYRQTPDGQNLGMQLKGLYQTLGVREKALLDVVLGTLDQLAARLRALDGALNPNGTKGKD